MTGAFSLVITREFGAENVSISRLSDAAMTDGTSVLNANGLGVWECIQQALPVSSAVPQ